MMILMIYQIIGSKGPKLLALVAMVYKINVYKMFQNVFEIFLYDFLQFSRYYYDE